MSRLLFCCFEKWRLVMSCVCETVWKQVKQQFLKSRVEALSNSCRQSHADMAQHSSRVNSTFNVKTFFKLHFPCWQYTMEIQAKSKDIKDEFPLKLAWLYAEKSIFWLKTPSLKRGVATESCQKSSVDVNKLWHFWNYFTQFLEVNKYFERTEKFGCDIKSTETTKKQQKLSSCRAYIKDSSTRFHLGETSIKGWAWIFPVVTEYVQNTSAWDLKLSCPSTLPVTPHMPLTHILWWRRPQRPTKGQFLHVSHAFHHTNEK